MAVALLEETDLFVLQSTSAEAALELMATKGERIAMLFTDIGLGGEMDGVMLSCTVREQWPHTLTVVTSGGAGERIRNLPPEAIFMPKPWLGLEVLLQAERASGRMKRKLSGEA